MVVGFFVEYCLRIFLKKKYYSLFLMNIFCNVVIDWESNVYSFFLRRGLVRIIRILFRVIEFVVRVGMVVNFNLVY